MSTLIHNGRTSNRVTDLTDMPRSQWDWPSRSFNEQRGWWPNRVAFHRVTKEAVINTQRSGDAKHWSLSAKALHDAIEAEKAGKVPQAYVRLSNSDGAYVTQETCQNLWRHLRSVPPHHGSWGDYWWLDEDLNCYNTASPVDMAFPY
jgi:hypothetical protein